MAFGYPANQSIKPSIDFSRCEPISVIVNFNRDGKIMPVMFNYVDRHQNYTKVNIDGIKYTKDGDGSLTYCCVANNGRWKYQVNLTFWIMEHIWVLER